MRKLLLYKIEVKLLEDKSTGERNGDRMERTVYLLLENGKYFEGKGFGASLDEVTGEVVFTTGMTGYLETITDPSYYGQIVVQTFPMIGNYGVIPQDFENKEVYLSAYIVKEWCQDPSNFRSSGNLDTFFKERKVPAIYGIDTRKLAKTIREYGSMNGRLTVKKPPYGPEELEQIRNFRITSAVESVTPAGCHLIKTKVETHKTDTSLAVVLSGFFGLGMALNSYIQGNQSYQGASQSGLANYIFGQAAFITKQDLWLIFGVSLVSMLVMTMFYKEIKIYVFDAQFMEVSGFNNKIIDTLITITMVAIIAAGLKVVGSILISSMLIAPVVAAMQWSKRYNVVVLIAALVGGLSSFIGTVFSSLYAGVSTGPAIVLAMSFIAIISIIFGRWGVVKTAIRRKAIKNV